MTQEEAIYYDATANDGGGVKPKEHDLLAELPQSLRIGLGGIVKIAPPDYVDFWRASGVAQLYSEKLEQPYHGLLGGLKVPVGYTFDGAQYHDFEGLQRSHDKAKEKGLRKPWNITAKIVNRPSDGRQFKRAFNHVARLVDEQKDDGIGIEAVEVSVQTPDIFRTASQYLFDIGVSTYIRFDTNNTQARELIEAISKHDARLNAKFVLRLEPDIMDGIRDLAKCMVYALRRGVPFAIQTSGQSKDQSTDRFTTGNNVGLLNLLMATVIAKRDVRDAFPSIGYVSRDLIDVLKELDASEFEILEEGIVWRDNLYRNPLLSEARRWLHSVDYVRIQNLVGGLERLRSTLQSHQ